MKTLYIKTEAQLSVTKFIFTFQLNSITIIATVMMSISLN